MIRRFCKILPAGKGNFLSTNYGDFVVSMLVLGGFDFVCFGWALLTTG